MDIQNLIRNARAKIMWGESRQSVLEYLQQNEIGDKDAIGYIDALFQARAADIRKTGIKKIVIGIFFVALLLAYLAISMFIGAIEIKLLAMTGISALAGTWKIIEGISYILKPGSESGDLSSITE
ncbi:MAG: hypothetical protein ACAH89_07165 [Rariglobus sp.]|nr:hypothetical protein [Rariglobus sp.]